VYGRVCVRAARRANHRQHAPVDTDLAAARVGAHAGRLQALRRLMRAHVEQAAGVRAQVQLLVQLQARQLLRRPARARRQGSQAGLTA